MVWILFLLLVFFFLALDLGIFNKEPHVITYKSALRWTTLWVVISLLFSVFIYYAYNHHWLGIGIDVGQNLPGKQAMIYYLTGYIVELSLSVDNIFVIAMIFSYFKIPQKYQHRVLFWGIIGALVFRGIMIAVGAALVSRFEWILYVFAIILLYSAYKMLTSGDEEIVPEKNPVIRLARKFFPVVTKIDGEQFFIKKMGMTVATPLFIALIMVETTDVIFAFDSIPAIFSITTDPFLVFTSNIFAILGLRSMYFVLVAFLNKFEFLKYSLVFILFFIGVKMLASHYVHPPEWLSLVVIIVSLIVGVVASILHEDKPKQHQ